MSHINIPDKTKGQGNFDLQFFPQQGKDEDKLIFYKPSIKTDDKKPKNSSQPLLFSLRFQKIGPAPENDVSNLICCL